MDSMYAIIILLIVVLILAGIAASAVQQHREHKEAELREEINKQKTIIDEAESAIKLASQMPVSQQFIALLHKRILNAHKQCYETNPQRETKQHIIDVKNTIESIDITEPPPDLGTFRLPSSDKIIIKYIQAIKKLRLMLRSENKKGNIPPEVFSKEDKQLGKLQLRVNIETLYKRTKESLRTQMAGSAKQYSEKAIAALKKQNPQDDYTTTKIAEFEQLMKKATEVSLASFKNEPSEEEKHHQEDIDSLFAPKKKW